MDSLEKQFINVGQVELHVVTAGPEDGEPLILLHGFPEFWYGWSKQIPYLADKGYRLIVPDQRGYNLSDKPTGRGNYTLDILAQDIANLIDACGYEKVNVVGHDWGGVITWTLAMLYPEKLKRIVILNAPHPHAMTNAFMQGNIMQMFKSAYMGFFQLPLIPETLISLDGYQKFGEFLQSNATSGAFSDEDIENYRRGWSQPGAMTAMLNYYRASVLPAQGRILQNKGIIHTPTLMLWGEKDVALGKELAQPGMDLVEDGELVFFPNATHWIQHDSPESVNEEIHNFLSQPIPETV